MHFSRLEISSIRNISGARLDELAPVNLFYGANGSGKTSILEAIHLLSLGRSFRSRRFASVIQHGEEAATVFAQANDPISQRRCTAGVTRSRSKPPEIRLDGESVTALARLAEQFPLQLLNADSFGLIEGGAAVRRQFLDWGVFHVEHRFIQEWQAAKKCIKHRNSLLRHGKIAAADLAPWSRELAERGEAVHACRHRYLQDFQQELLPTIERVAGIHGLSVEYDRGWSEELDLAEALQRAEPRDRQLGYTGPGPQRADLKLKVNGRPAMDVLSRGQEKILVCAMRIAQAAHLGRTTNKHCAFLIDDLPAELDASHRRVLCTELGQLSSQVFITCVEPQDLAPVWADLAVQPSMFHVEHGQVVQCD